ncbi:MAG: hypothetical protein FWG36_07175 [Oscillospiraceae bacterium]|nr:hypothetical protein [Oscillospiraceae bacterium]
MVKKRWTIGVTAFLVLSLLVGVLVAYAAETGSQADPVISQSYITEEFQPQIMRKIEDVVKKVTDDYAGEMNAKINQLASQSGGSSFNTSSLIIDPDFINAIAAAVIEQMPVTSSGGGTAGGMAKVEVANGKTLSLELGSSIVLRLGSATCVASGSPGLINLTTGGDLAADKVLEKNHLYLATIAGRGFKATADVTVFVSGGYTIS